jgi:uncharacterized SAM-binding protein YcdF (DUF218 family)
VKEFLSLIIMPIPILFFLVLATFILYQRKKKKSGKIFLFVTLCWFVVIITRPIPVILIKNLENKYRQLTDSSIRRLPDSTNIIVLGAGHSDDEKLSPNNRLSEAALGRLVEGIRIYKAMEGRRGAEAKGRKGKDSGSERLRDEEIETRSDEPERSGARRSQIPRSGTGSATGGKLIVSGYAGRLSVSQAEVLYKTAIMLGIDSTDIILSPLPANTKEEAEQYIKMCGPEKELIVVTSAVHMPRAVKLFKKVGVKVIPAPTNYIIKHGSVKNPSGWIPSSENISMMEQAIHEYAGLLWAGMGGN